MLSTARLSLLPFTSTEVVYGCNAGYAEGTPDRVNSRNGYRRREQDTRAGTIELAIPKLRAGSYFPTFLEHRRRAERAQASVVATSYLLGLDPMGGEAGRLPGGGRAVEVADVCDGGGAGRGVRRCPSGERIGPNVRGSLSRPL